MIDSMKNSHIITIEYTDQCQTSMSEVTNNNGSNKELRKKQRIPQHQTYNVNFDYISDDKCPFLQNPFSG
jgi:hypothetical protein